MAHPPWPPAFIHCLKLREAVKAAEAALNAYTQAFKELEAQLKKAGEPNAGRVAVTRMYMPLRLRLERQVAAARLRLKRECNWTS